MSLFGPAYPERRKVIVSLAAGNALQGVLWERHAEYLVLKGAELLEAGRDAQPLVGEVLVYRENVDWIQVTD